MIFGVSTTTRSLLLAAPSNWTRASLAYRAMGFFLASAGEPDEGIAVLEKGMRLSPRDPWLFDFSRARVTLTRSPTL